MTRKRRKNLIMIAVIAVVLAAGVFAAGKILGWFGRPADASVIEEVRGLVSIERGGIAVNAEKGMALQKGDKINCPAGSSVKISAGSGTLVLSAGTSAVVEDPSERALTASVSSGEAFARAEDDPVTISVGDRKTTLKKAAAAFAAEDGLSRMSVFSGEADGVKAGEEKEWTGADPSVHNIDINSLDDFIIAQLKAAGDDAGMVFAKADLEELEARRAAEAEEAAARAEEEARKAAEDAARQAAERAAEVAEEQRKAIEEEEARKAEEERKAREEEERRRAEEEAKKTYCYISIRCGTILDNMDEFDPAKTQYVPENGVILGRKKIEFTAGETVFDVLKRACKTYGRQLEYSYNPAYKSAYIEGIAHIYEFDCGPESGWMYKVNGVFPNYGCSNYELSKDDEIVWLYTCHGLGADVGGSNR